MCLLLASMGTFAQSKLVRAGKSTAAVAGTSKATKPSTKPSTKSRTTTQKKPATRPVAGNVVKVKDILFGNTDSNGNVIDNFGRKLYAGELRYLQPQLIYDGLTSTARDINVYVKIIDEDGDLKTAQSSPNGYTFDDSFSVKPGKDNRYELPGWGNNSCQYYEPGLYTYEVWHKGKCLISKQFRLYSGAAPLSKSSLLTINGVTLSNEDYDGNTLSNVLYDGEVQYVAATLSYTGHNSSEQKAKLYYRFFNSNGDLIHGNNSPEGFSSSQDVTIAPGYNSMKIYGYGSKETTVYTEGEHKIEYWLDGEKIYETTFNVVKKGSQGSSYSGTTSAAINEFFPIYGLTLGKSTWDDAKRLGYNVKQYENGPKRHVDAPNSMTFWDHEGDGIWSSVYTVHSEEMAPLWKQRGLSWAMSYDQCINFFKSRGYSINVKKEPHTTEYDNRKTLTASFDAVSPDGFLEFELDFDYGNANGEGYSTSSRNTLYGILVSLLKNDVAATGTQTPSGNVELIKNLITNPLDITTCNVFTTPRSEFLRQFRNKYTVSEQDEKYPDYYYATISDNAYKFNKLSYCGVPLDRMSCFLHDNATRVCYLWDVTKSEHPDMYAMLDALVSDLNKLGIPMSYKRTGEEHDVAKGEAVFAGKSYEVELSDYGTSYWVQLVIDTRL